MTRKDIEKEAKDRCTSEHMEEWNKDFGISCFIDGAEWRINSVWHDASEVPEKKPALVEYSHFPKGHGYLVVPDPREVLRSITRYAYIEDLIRRNNYDAKTIAKCDE